MTKKRYASGNACPLFGTESESSDDEDASKEASVDSAQSQSQSVQSVDTLETATGQLQSQRELQIDTGAAAQIELQHIGDHGSVEMATPDSPTSDVEFIGNIPGLERRPLSTADHLQQRQIEVSVEEPPSCGFVTWPGGQNETFRSATPPVTNSAGHKELHEHGLT